MDFKEMRSENMDWNHLAQDKDQWRTLLNTLMNSAFHKKRRISRLVERLSASQEELSAR